MASVDPLDLNTKFAEEHKADFPLLSDPNKETAKAYGVLGPQATSPVATRWTFYIDKDGKISFIDKAVTPSTRRRRTWSRSWASSRWRWRTEPRHDRTSDLIAR